MKKLITFLFLVFTSFSIFSQKSFTVEVANIETLEGYLMVAIFNESQFADKEEMVAGKKVRVTAETQLVTFENLAVGEYSVSVYLDENNDEELDTNFIGYPTEQFGFSNNPKLRFGPPSFEDCKINIVEKNLIQIYLN